MIYTSKMFHKITGLFFKNECSSYIISTSASQVLFSHVLLSDIHFLQITGSNEVIHCASKGEMELVSISPSWQPISKSQPAMLIDQSDQAAVTKMCTY